MPLLFSKLPLNIEPDPCPPLTSRCNQDGLENLFSRIRQLGGPNDHPTPVDALHRIRLLILGQQAQFAVPSAPVPCPKTDIEDGIDEPCLSAKFSSTLD